MEETILQQEIYELVERIPLHLIDTEFRVAREEQVVNFPPHFLAKHSKPACARAVISFLKTKSKVNGAHEWVKEYSRANQVLLRIEKC